MPSLNDPAHFGNPDRATFLRLRWLEKKGLRCDGNDRRCVAGTATREMTLGRTNPDTGEYETTVVKACSRHRKNWERLHGWEVLGFKMLAGLPDPDTGRLTWGCYDVPDST